MYPFGAASSNNEWSSWNKKATTTNGTTSWLGASNPCMTQPVFGNSASHFAATSTKHTEFTSNSQTSGSAPATQKKKPWFVNDNQQKATTSTNQGFWVQGNIPSMDNFPTTPFALPRTESTTAQSQQPIGTTPDFSFPVASNGTRQSSVEKGASESCFSISSSPFVNPSSSLTSESQTPFQRLESKVSAFVVADEKPFLPSNRTCNALVADGLAKLNKASRLFPPHLLPSKRRCREIEKLLSDSFVLFCDANYQSFFEDGTPSVTALYNVACVYSLALELQLSLFPTSDSLQDMVDCCGDTPIEELQKGGFFVAPLVAAKENSRASKTLRDVIKQRASACDRCIKAAVATGWTDFRHLLTDRDLRLYVTSADTSWLHSKVYDASSRS